MIPLNAYDQISHVFTTRENSILKFECDINVGADETVYVQLHDARSLPEDGAVPLKSWACASGQQGFYKEFKSGELHFANGIVAVVSTTEDELTAGTGNNKFDMVAVELTHPILVTGTSFQGDETTSTNFLAVWANGQRKKIYRIIINNTFGTGLYLFLQPDATKSNTNGAIYLGYVPYSAAAVILDFGRDGRMLSDLPIDSVNGPNFGGCRIVLATDIAGTTFAEMAAIMVEYKNFP